MKAERVSRAAAAVCAALCAASLAVTVFFMRRGAGADRAVLYFDSYDSDVLCTEVRYLPRGSVQGREHLLVDEFVLGPMTNRYRRAFAPGTRVEFFAVQDGTAYVGLSREALSTTAEAADIRRGVEILKVNIVKNFTKINTVLVYIDGASAYAEG